MRDYPPNVGHYRRQRRAASSQHRLKTDSPIIDDLPDKIEIKQQLITDGTGVDGAAVSHYLRDAAAADAIEPDRLLTRVESVPVHIIERGTDKVRANIGGAVYTLPAAVLDALDTLSNSHTQPAGSLLANASTELSTRTARTLVRIGLLRTI
jgi:hypothetical protein